MFHFRQETPRSGLRQNGSKEKAPARDLPDRNRIQALLREQTEKEWLSYSTLVEEIDPLACIEKLNGEKDLFYWEKPDEPFAIAAGGVTAMLKATGKERFEEIAAQSLELKSRHLLLSSIRHSLAEPILVGGYSFSDHNIQESWNVFGAARFVLPRWCLIRSGKLHILTLNLSLRERTAADIADGIGRRMTEFRELCRTIRSSGFPDTDETEHTSTLTLSPNRPYREWRERVELSRAMITAGMFKKIVLSRRLDVEAERTINVPHALYQFRRRFPGCFNFMIKADGEATFMGTSPERLVSLNSSHILTEGLAGSIARGESAVEDLTLGRSLMESRKERAEHHYVVEDIRNNLKPFVRKIEYPEEPVLKKLENVQHLYTPITAQVKREMTIHQLVGTLHPTPAVGGFPKEQALPHINHIENLDRGWYAGPLGWFNLAGNGEFAVAIRSALVKRNRARLYAGSGIVRDSDPEQEWQETTIKFHPVLEALKLATTDPEKNND